MSLREEMQQGCNDKLNDMSKALMLATDKICKGTGILSTDLMRLNAGRRTTTISKKLLSKLMVNAEAELVKIWNNQVDAFVDDKAEKL